MQVELTTGAVSCSRSPHVERTRLPLLPAGTVPVRRRLPQLARERADERLPESGNGVLQVRSPLPPPCRPVLTASSCSRDGIKLDLTTERPRWVMSSYGPGKGEPSMISGLDVSPEELRLQFYTARTQNNPALYVRDIRSSATRKLLTSDPAA